MAGSDQIINYQIRPAKSVERKMLCDLIREVQVLQGNRELRYIGMGAKYFADFLLFHNEFAIKDMISIEAKKEYQQRYDFNKPLKCIEMRYGTTNEMLPQIDKFEEKTNFVWLDYDDPFSQNMLLDVETMCRNLEIGSMFFISCNFRYRGQLPSEKQADFKRYVGDYFDEGIETKEYTSKRIPFVIRKLFDKQIEKTLQMRNRGQQSIKYEYLQLIFLKYQDGIQMMTIGGIIVDDKMKKKILESEMISRLEFLAVDENIYDINVPKLTNKEIQLILSRIPITEEEYEAKKDEFYGIEYKEIKNFEKIYRYYPHYSESCYTT